MKGSVAQEQRVGEGWQRRVRKEKERLRPQGIIGRELIQIDFRSNRTNRISESNSSIDVKFIDAKCGLTKCPVLLKRRGKLLIGAE